MMYSSVVLALAILAMVTTCAQANPLAALASGSRAQTVSEQWNLIKDGLQTNRKSLCSFLLQDIVAGEESLNVHEVTELFERSLDHLAKASEYMAKIRPFVEPRVMQDFDSSGGLFVLQISDSRRRLIEEFEKAEENNVSEESKQKLLNEYFFKACSSKLGTILAEKSMYDSLLKVEKRIKATLAL